MAIGGVLAQTMTAIGYDTWRLASAVAVVAFANMLRVLVLRKYEAVDKPQEGDKKGTEQRWKAINSISTFFLIVMVIISVKASRIVLDQQWIEQVTSALVVGIGFGLQSTIQDIMYGYIRRTDSHVMDSSKTLVITIANKPVTGKIKDMSLNTFTFEQEKNGGKWVLPWTALREFEVVS